MQRYVSSSIAFFNTKELKVPLLEVMAETKARPRELISTSQKIRGIFSNLPNRHYVINSKLLLKFLSVICVFMLLFSSLPLSPDFSLSASALELDKWNAVDVYGRYKYADFSPFIKGADGTVRSPYIISNEEQLSGFAVLVNSKGSLVKDKNGIKMYGTDFTGKKINLNSNINLSAHEWVPIGSGNKIRPDKEGSYVFSGTFDGRNKEIKNMKIGSKNNPANYRHAGLFGSISDSNILNVKIAENSEIYIRSNSLNNYIGGIVGASFGKGSKVIRNCSSKCNIYSSNKDSNSYVGGIIGSSFIIGGLNIISCYNEGNVYSGFSSGGIAGNLYGFGNMEVRNCKNLGTVYCDKDYAGGILGCTYICSNNMGATLKINKCFNAGDIHSKAPYNSRVGGISGFAKSYNSTRLIVDTCYNSGKLYSSYSAGGVFGYADVYGELTLINCYNTKEVYSTDKDSDFRKSSFIYSAGIVSVACVCGGMQIINCYNLGNITASSLDHAFAGGITSYVDVGGKLTINNCYSTGSIYSADLCHGGIIGYNSDISNITLENCFYCKQSINLEPSNKDIKSENKNITGKSIMLSEDQMKAISLSPPKSDWVSTGVDEEASECIPLIDVLNKGVEDYNNTNPEFSALCWETSIDSSYPVYM